LKGVLVELFSKRSQLDIKYDERIENQAHMGGLGNSIERQYRVSSTYREVHTH